MIYIFLSLVLITISFLLGAWSFFGFAELWRKNYPINWSCYQHVIILAAAAAVCFILAVLFGIQIPENYGI